MSPPKPVDQDDDRITPQEGAAALARMPLEVVGSHQGLLGGTPQRISTDLNRCSIAHAVWYEPISRVRWRLSADTPSFWVANSQHAMNHTVSGVRVRSKIVPAVTDERPPHPAHQTRLSPSRQPPWWLQRGHTKPSGHRSHSR